MNIQKRIEKVIEEELGEVNVNLTDRFREDLGADSLDELEIVIALEDEFGLGIHDGDAESIKTVQDAIDYITQKVNSDV